MLTPPFPPFLAAPQVSVVRLLLSRGADYGVVDHQNKTPRQVAQAAGHAQCVKLVSVSHPLVTSLSFGGKGMDPWGQDRGLRPAEEGTRGGWDRADGLALVGFLGGGSLRSRGTGG
jgi:hypothetical protein